MLSVSPTASLLIVRIVSSPFCVQVHVSLAVEKDRAALGLGRLEYLQYLVFRRYEAAVKNGPGFDRESPPERARR